MLTLYYVLLSTYIRYGAIKAHRIYYFYDTFFFFASAVYQFVEKSI